MSAGRDSQWVDVGAVSEIPLRGSRQIRVKDLVVAIFRTADQRLFAIEDQCPHRQGPLSQGIVHGSSVTCPLHNWVISLESGQVVGDEPGCVRTVGVKLENGRVLLKFPFFSERAA